MNIRTQIIAALALSWMMLPAMGATFHDQTGTIVPGSQPIGQGYTLLTNGTATGASVINIVSGSYGLVCVATAWNSSTATLQYLAPDGVTWLVATSPSSTTAALTANGSVYAVVGQNATVRIAVTGGTPTALNCNMS